MSRFSGARAASCHASQARGQPLHGPWPAVVDVRRYLGSRLSGDRASSSIPCPVSEFHLLNSLSPMNHGLSIHQSRSSNDRAVSSTGSGGVGNENQRQGSTLRRPSSLFHRQTLDAQTTEQPLPPPLALLSVGDHTSYIDLASQAIEQSLPPRGCMELPRSTLQSRFSGDRAVSSTFARLGDSCVTRSSRSQVIEQPLPTTLRRQYYDT